jgi:hypothetical protein
MQKNGCSLPSFICTKINSKWVKNGKMRPVETIPGMRGEGNKKE